MKDPQEQERIVTWRWILALPLFVLLGLLLHICVLIELLHNFITGQVNGILVKDDSGGDR